MLENLLIELLWSNQYRGIVYFQPNANHHTFWSQVDIQKVAIDFEKLSDIGFTSVVIRPSWGDFVSEIRFWKDPDKVKYVLNNESFDKLNQISDIANSQGLDIFISSNISTTPKLYDDNGETLSTEIYTANYWISFSEFLPREPALYEDPNMQHHWSYFHMMIAKTLSDKTNIAGYIIEPETSGEWRELTPSEIQNCIKGIRKGDVNAIIGYQVITSFIEETCNIPNANFVSIGGYPSNIDEILNATQELSRISMIRKFTNKPIIISETGVSTNNNAIYPYSMTEKEQAIYCWSVEQLANNHDLGVIGYNLWCMSDFFPNSFGSPGNWTDTQSSFGLFRTDGSEKPVVPLLRNLFDE